MKAKVKLGTQGREREGPEEGRVFSRVEVDSGAQLMNDNARHISRAQGPHKVTVGNGSF